ncbi:MAG: creatininase family protein [Acidimicrobiia bacterium]|nr:creatininase family protein [Acidimicrobiia bacterium]
MGTRSDAGEQRRLENLTAPEIAERIGPGSVLVWPIGAVEQHGPHLPLSVDHVVAHESARAAVAACGEEADAWLLPTLSISKSDEHAWSPGSLWLSAETLLAVIGDVGRSAATTGAERLVFLNAHGGNTALLGVACRELRRRFGLRTFLVHPFVPPDHGGRSASAADELGMGVHGGHDETSVMLHLRPELVRMDRAVRRVPEGLAEQRHVRFGGLTAFGWLSNDFGPDGHIGDPTGATPEAGKNFFEAAVELVAEQIAEISTFDFGR